MRTYRAVLLAFGLCGLSPGCDQAVDEPAASTVTDVDLVALEKAVAWPNAAVNAVVSLANTYIAKGLPQQGYAYFAERAEAEPDNGVFVAYAGLFQAQSASQRPLLGRVDWVERAIDRLDSAVSKDPNLPRFLRAVTLARLPERFGVAQEAIDELEALLSSEGSFIFSDRVQEQTRQALIRQGWQAMALAASTAGRSRLSDEAWALANERPLTPSEPMIGTNYSVDARDGFRFARPNIEAVVPWIHVAHGYDFADIAFIETSEGLVVVDAGTDAENTTKALADVREIVGPQPVHTILVTHAHWDHIGGLGGLVEPGTEVIAQSRFAEELEIVNAAALDYEWFFGERTQRSERYGPLYEIQPDRLVADTTDLVIGGVSLRLHPLPGGETDDALLIELPSEGIVFTGDSFMPYLGAPFVGEGSADQLLETIDFLRTLDPQLLVHGHPPLTNLYTAEVLEPLGEALRIARQQTMRGIIDRKPVVQIVREDPMPDMLREFPDAVMPFFVLRQQFIQRLHRQRTGYWQPEGDGLVLVSEGEWAEVMDLLAQGDEARWVEVVGGLVTRGEHPLAWRMAERGLLSHPESLALGALRDRALGGLRAKYQQFNPFKFIVFSELENNPNKPLNCGGPAC